MFEKIFLSGEERLFRGSESWDHEESPQGQGVKGFDKRICCDIDLIRAILAREGFPRGLRSDYRFGGSRPTVDSVEDFL